VGEAASTVAVRSLHIDTARTWRGGQNQVWQLLTGLQERGLPTVLAAYEGGELHRRAKEGVRFFGFTPRSEFDVHAGWVLARVLDDVKPEVVHAHDPMAVALGAMALQMRPRMTPRPILVAARRVDFHLKSHAFSKWKYRQIDRFIAASEVIAGILMSDGIPRDRISVVHDGVNVGLVDKQPRIDAHGVFWLPKGAPIVGNVAALAGHKGQRHLVAAAARVVREVPDARFLILGEGELRDALERQVKELGLERHVFLPGFRDDVLGLMKSFDLFAMSSVTEGLGSAMLEAMACRLAIVGSRAGGIPEAVLDGVTGLLVPPADDAALAGGIVTLLKDAARRAEFGDAGRQRVVAEFSIERMVDGTLHAYQAQGPGPRAQGWTASS
jgi:glycosyltransferase involved in cell wall biosynthesis